MKRSASLVITLLIVLLAAAWQGGVAGASRNADLQVEDPQVTEPLAPVAGAPTVVSYQGQVTVGGSPYTGPGYFKFAVVDAAPITHWSNDGTSGGGGEPAAAVQLAVANGQFSVLLGDTLLGNMTQPLTASVFGATARYLRVWFSATGGVGSFVLWRPTGASRPSPTRWQAEEVKNAWSLTGNAGTTPGTSFLGTTDSASLTLRVFNMGALRLEPNLSSPNVIGGNSDNFVTGGAVGAAIGGGGGGGSYANRVTDDWGTVGGGWWNRAGDAGGTTSDRTAATVGGGYVNAASGNRSTIGGGQENTASGEYATIAGGYQNAAGGERSAIAGGSRNTANAYAAAVCGGSDNTAGGSYATVPGGGNNSAAANFSLAAGRQAKADHPGAFVWADSTAADFHSTANDQFAVRANGGVVFSTGSALVQVNGNKVWHVGNDGASSTLDADLLDGQHASAFAISGHSHDHGGLTGLADDDHPQYFNLGQNEAVSGIPAFNGGTSGSSAPFTVDSTWAVSNLNADLLDGRDSSSFQTMLVGGCSPGYSYRVIDSDGTYFCEKDDDTTYTAGNQLSLSGTTFNVTEGTASGLDADLLDGWHGDYYRPLIATSVNGSTVFVTSSCTNYTWVSIACPGRHRRRRGERADAALSRERCERRSGSHPGHHNHQLHQRL